MPPSRERRLFRAVCAAGDQRRGGGRSVSNISSMIEAYNGIRGLLFRFTTFFISRPRGANPYLLIISTYSRGRCLGSYGTNISAVSSGSRTGKARAANAISAALKMSPQRYSRPSESIASTSLGGGGGRGCVICLYLTT